MKKFFVLIAIMAAACVSSFSQTTAVDYSGKWTLDVAASKLDERQRIESMTMTVTQTEKELKIATETKREAPPEGVAQAGRGGNVGRGGGMGLGDGGTAVYSLDGKETSVDMESPAGPIPVKYQAKQDGSVLKLSQTRTINTTTLSTKEDWSLSQDGKTLTVKRERTTPRGTFSSTMVFKKG